MKYFRITVLAFILLSFLGLISCEQQHNARKAKYVFFFIGDGMGIAQVTATEIYQSSISGKEYERVVFSLFPYVGFSKTSAANRYITGSAAAGTAMATGYQTDIGRISMDPNADSALVTIAEKASAQDMKVGIISSVSIDHATPASFYAHQPSRDMYHEIALDLAASDLDFFGGGGFREPVKGDVNAFESAQANGFNYINDAESFKALVPSKEKVLFINPLLTDDAAMLFAIDQPADYISLADITEKAIEYLDNENGFFMMVEGGKIDWACHANDAASMVHETIDFADAVNVALQFYYQHPEETLIIVTADHETGGLSIGNDLMKYDMDCSLLQHQAMSGTEFNRLLAEWRKENHINEKGFKKMLKLLEENFGIGGDGAPIVLTQNETERLRKFFMGMDLSQEGEYGDYSPLTYLTTRILSSHSGLGWTTKSHTGIPVPVYAIGVKGEAFSGNIDNTEIPKIIWEAIN